VKPENLIHDVFKVMVLGKKKMPIYLNVHETIIQQNRKL